MNAEKYPRTYHFPYSPGATQDDKICWEWEELSGQPLILTEKLDGENTCLKSNGVFARSHAAVTRNPWAQNMWPVWERVKSDLEGIEVFGENLFGVHSIEYPQLTAYFFVFGIRENGFWWPWTEVEQWCFLMDLPLVPVYAKGTFSPITLQKTIIEGIKVESAFGGPREGFVVRPLEGFHQAAFSKNVLKYVRAGHVQTDEHWTRNWRKAALFFE
ncbi:MAG: 2'-5' RNA ligase [Bacteroidetes bacterium]|nr:2'-5' RNA ligase [Bacteroidota bacterium]